MLPHAPQFFTMPKTEDRETVDRVKAAAAEIGARLKAMAPDLWIVISNDHVEQFFTWRRRLSRSMSAVGALGERKPDIVKLEPSWHHNYASLGWFGTPLSEPAPHYPSIKPELIELTAALHGLAHDEEMRRR
jgi:2,3-dihydroxyphenylpropionate 1,2-dioxygenase